MANQEITVSSEQAGATVAAVLRQCLPGQSWSQIRKMLAARLVTLNGKLWLDDARRVRAGDRLEVLDKPIAQPKLIDSIVIRHIDVHIIVVEKPAGIATVRHPAELDWAGARRALTPTLDDLVLHQIGTSPYAKGRGRGPRLRIVHRLDKGTSGLLVFARTVEAERGLGRQFRRHTVLRKYLAVVPGTIQTQTIRTILVPDRGDGRRGSIPTAERRTGSESYPTSLGKEAITHVEVVERVAGYTLLSCRLETGRTHQIRIHLAERGHPVCGEKVYNRAPGREPIEDRSGAPRLALHAAELGFQHPVTGEELHWSMPLPPDLRGWMEKLR
ncbi:MAG: RluA family pseudouridine synthase [Gemmataceae bacterium]|nr:RluA family pseudouridine synthase [Gemmataceae bacterium]